MKLGYPIVNPMKEQLLAFMEKHKFERIEDFKGHSVQYFTTHADLVKRQGDVRGQEGRARPQKSRPVGRRMERRRFCETDRRAGAWITQWPPYGNDLIRRGRAGHAPEST